MEDLLYFKFLNVFIKISEYFSYKLVVVGGGAGGCSTAAKFASKYPGQVAVIEPKEVWFFNRFLSNMIVFITFDIIFRHTITNQDGL